MDGHQVSARYEESVGGRRAASFPWARSDFACNIHLLAAALVFAVWERLPPATVICAW